MFNYGHDWPYAWKYREGWSQKQEEARDNLWGMSGGNIAHIYAQAGRSAYTAYAVRPSPFRDSSVRVLALVDKEGLTAVLKSLSAQ